MFNQKDLTRITCNMMQPMPASLAHQLSHWEFHAETSKRCKVQLWEVVFCLTNSPYLNRLADDQNLNRKQKAEVKKSTTSKAENSLQFQETALHLQYDDKSNFSAVARCGNDSRHAMLSENTLRLRILAARKSVEAAYLTMPTNSAVKCSLE